MLFIIFDCPIISYDRYNFFFLKYKNEADASEVKVSRIDPLYYLVARYLLLIKELVVLEELFVPDCFDLLSHYYQLYFSCQYC